MNGIGRMDNHGITLGEAGAHFCSDAIVVSDLHFQKLRFALPGRERHPIIAPAEQGTCRHL